MNITIDHLFFRYQRDWILEDVTINLKANQFYAFLGPNGGGKTTLIKVLIGLLKGEKGNVLINNTSPRKIRDQIGYVPQTLDFDPQFPISAYEFLLMGSLSKLTLLGRWPISVKKQAINMLETLGMSDQKNTPVGKLSGGQRQRLSLGRALLSNPSLLLLDEPISGLDPLSHLFLHQKLKELKNQKTIILVTHAMGQCFELVDEAIYIDRTAHWINQEGIYHHFHTDLEQSR